MIADVSASSSRSSSSLASRVFSHGESLRRHSPSAFHRLPIPATRCWSRSASPRSRAGKRRRFASISSSAGGSARMSGPPRRRPPLPSSSTGPFQRTPSRVSPRSTSQGRPTRCSPRGRSCQRPLMRRRLRRTTPPSNSSSRCLPTASTFSSRLPSRRSASWSDCARGWGVSTSIRSPTRGCSRAAARCRLSPSGTTVTLPFVPKLSKVRSGVASALNIAALAQRTGVQPDTLRKWEHRYGVIRPDRTPGGQRRYTDHDVARVEWLKARLAEGYRIGEAAALLGGEQHEEAPQTSAELRDALYARVTASDAPGLEQLVAQSLTVLPIHEAIADVLVPVLVRVGSGWAEGELTVAQEHLATSVIRAHLERLLAD